MQLLRRRRKLPRLSPAAPRQFSLVCFGASFSDELTASLLHADAGESAHPISDLSGFLCSSDWWSVRRSRCGPWRCSATHRRSLWQQTHVPACRRPRGLALCPGAACSGRSVWREARHTTCGSRAPHCPSATRPVWREARHPACGCGGPHCPSAGRSIWGQAGRGSTAWRTVRRDPCCCCYRCSCVWSPGPRPHSRCVCACTWGWTVWSKASVPGPSAASSCGCSPSPAAARYGGWPLCFEGLAHVMFSW